jgi:hypothetical protein
MPSNALGGILVRIPAAGLRKRRPKPHTVWHLDEVYLKINGRMVYLWRAVDAEGEVLDVLVQTRRNRTAALKLMRKLLKKYAFGWSPTICALTPPPSVILGSRGVMTAVDGATTEPRIHINRPDDENARCRGSRAPVRRNDSSQRIPPFRIPSTSNPISPRHERTGPSGRRRCRRGAKLPRRLDESNVWGLLRLDSAT